MAWGCSTGPDTVAPSRPRISMITALQRAKDPTATAEMAYLGLALDDSDGKNEK